MFQYLDEQNKKQLFYSVFAVFVLLAAFLGVKAIDALKEYRYIGYTNLQPNVISVSGTGEATAIPDTGSFSFSVVENAKTTGDASDLAAKKANEIIAAVKAMGVEDKDIKTTGYNLYPKYEYNVPALCTNGYCPGGKQVLTGYEVSQTISVKVRKTADAGAILAKVGSLGAQNISGLDFVIDNMDAINAEARDKAIENAKAKAAALSQSLGVHLTKIINFYESGNGGPIYYDKAMNAAPMGAGASAPVPPQVQTGENTVTSNVTITYQVD